MNETDLYLLEKHGVIVLPYSLEHDAYVNVIEAIHRSKGNPLTVYCDGEGGSSHSGQAIAGLVQHLDNITGIVIAEAQSSHSVVFMSCAHRYVYPAAAIAIHMIAFSDITSRVDSRRARLIDLELTHGDRQNARIYAQASNPEYDETYWYNRLQETGSAGVQMIDADELICMGIARPIAEWTAPQRMSDNGRDGILAVREG